MEKILRISIMVLFVVLITGNKISFTAESWLSSDFWSFLGVAVLLGTVAILVAFSMAGRATTHNEGWPFQHPKVAKVLSVIGFLSTFATIMFLLVITVVFTVARTIDSVIDPINPISVFQPRIFYLLCGTVVFLIWSLTIAPLRIVPNGMWVVINDRVFGPGYEYRLNPLSLKHPVLQSQVIVIKDTTIVDGKNVTIHGTFVVNPLQFNNKETRTLGLLFFNERIKLNFQELVAKASTVGCTWDSFLTEIGKYRNTLVIDGVCVEYVGGIVSFSTFTVEQNAA